MSLCESLRGLVQKDRATGKGKGSDRDRERGGEKNTKRRNGRGGGSDWVIHTAEACPQRVKRSSGCALF